MGSTITGWSLTERDRWRVRACAARWLSIFGRAETEGSIGPKDRAWPQQELAELCTRSRLGLRGLGRTFVRASGQFARETHWPRSGSERSSIPGAAVGF